MFTNSAVMLGANGLILRFPAVSTGFTDSHFFRDRGIASYGYAPFLVPEADESGVHGNNERISIENVRTGTQMMYEIVKSMVAN